MLGAPNNALLITFVIGKKGENSIDIMHVYVYKYSMVNEIFSVNEAARELGLDTSQIRRLLAKGEIKGKKLGRDWVVLELNYQRKRKPKEKRK